MMICRYLIKNNVFEPVMSAFFDNGDRYNLFNSSVLDMFNYIRKEGMRNLIEHLVQNFGQRLGEFDHMHAVKDLCLRFEQLNEPDSAAAAAAAAVNEVADVLAGVGSGSGAGSGEVSSHPHGSLIHGRTFLFSSSGEPLGDGMSAASMRRRRRDDRDMDEHEEDYFASDGADGDDMDGVEDVLDLIDQELAAAAAAGEDEEGGYPGIQALTEQTWKIGPDLGRRKRMSEEEDEEEGGEGERRREGGASGRAALSENNAGTLRPRQRIVLSAAASEPVGDLGRRKAADETEVPPTATALLDGPALMDGSDGGGWRLVGYEDEDDGSDQQLRPTTSLRDTKSIKLGPGDSPGRIRQ